MRKSVKKSPIKKRSTKTDEKLDSSELSANQQRFLQLLITGIDNEPDVLAGRRCLAGNKKPLTRSGFLLPAAFIQTANTRATSTPPLPAPAVKRGRP